MVDFIRERTRQYAADQSGAIRQEQLANNVKEWNSVIQGAGSIAQSIEKQRQKELKLQEEADEQMINTQIGSKAQTELLKWNVAQIEAGVDPNTDEYTQKLYAKRDELYQPYLDRMTSEKGRNILQKQGLDTAERIRQSNIGQIAKNRQKAQARQAFADTVKNVQNDARGYGKLGDWEGFKEATKNDRKALSDYAKSNLGDNAKKADYAMDMQNLQNFVLGQAETDPEEVVKVFGTKEDYQDIKRDDQKSAKSQELKKMLDDAEAGSKEYKIIKEKLDEVESVGKVQELEKQLKEAKPDSKEYKDIEKKLKEAKSSPSNFADRFEYVSDKQYEKEGIEEYARQKKLDYLPAEAVKQVTDSFVKSKKEEKQAIEQEMKGVAKGSKQHESLEKKRDEVQEQIDNPQKYVVDAMTEDIRKAVVPIAKKKIGENRLLQQKIAEDNVIDTYTMVMNPDTSVSFEAQMALSLGQPAVEQLFQHSISDEEMHKAYDAYAQAKVGTLTREHATLEGTQGMADKMYTLINNRSANKIVQVKDALEFLAELNKSPVTQDQWDDANNMMYGVLQDQVFGDMVASVLEDNNRYFPDMPMAFYGTADLVPAQNISDIGLPSTNLSTLDVDSVKNYLDKESVRISKDAMAMLGKAAQLPTPQLRAEAVNQVSNFVATEKQKVYDNAMKTYGLDLAKLRENKKNFGQAFTQLSSRVVVEYMGDDPYSGKPLFRQLDNYKEITEARKRILDGLESSKQQKKGKEE